MPITNYARDQLLDAIFNADTTGFPAGDVYVQLHSGDPNATGASNVVSVARVQVAFGAAASGTLSNTGAIDFTTMPAVGAPGVVGWSAHDTAGSGLPPTGGNAVWYGLFTGTTPLAGTGEVTTAGVTSNDIVSAAHGLSADDRIALFTLPGAPGGTPTGPTYYGTGTGVLYYVLSAGLTADSFNLSTSSGGAELDFTTDGTLAWVRVVPKTTNLNDTFRIGAGDLDVYLEA
jgi:hypothetical protein